MLPPHLDLTARNARARALHGRALGRDAVASERIERGWPNLRILDDAASVSPHKAAAKLLKSIDPSLGPVWPRDVAIRWVNAFLRGADGFTLKGKALDAAASSTELPEPALLRKLFDRALGSTSDYPYQHADALWIVEALLGPDVVVRTFVEAIEAAPPEAWCWPNSVFTNPNQRAISQVTAMGWVILRANARVAEDALTSIRAARERVAEAGPFARAIDFLLGDAIPDVADEPERRQRVAHLSEDLAKARAGHDWRLWICDPQDLWVTGVTPPLSALEKLGREPRDLAEQLVHTWGVFDHPFANALREAVTVRPKKLTKTALTAEVRALFDRLVAGVKAVRGDEAAEASLFQKAAQDLMSLRSRGGDPMPEAHIGHILGVDGWDEKTLAPVQTLKGSPDEIERWLEAISAGVDAP